MGELDRVRFGSKIVDRRTSEMLAEAERLAQTEDPSIDDFHLPQGCFHTGVAASAGPHSGPGAFDMYTESARMMFRVMWRTCFDEQPSDPVFEHVLGALQFFGKRNPPLVEILFTLLPVLSRRPQRVSAAVDPIDQWIYERLQAENAVFGEYCGLEHALWFGPAGTEPSEDITFRRSNAHAVVAEECRAVREAVGIIEISNYGKFEVTGSGHAIGHDR